MKVIKKVFLFFLISGTFLYPLLLLALTVIGENGSIVYYNDKLIGTIKNASITFDATFPGYLKVIKPGYISFEKYLTEDGTITATLTLPSYLQLNVNPKDAVISIDGFLQKTLDNKIVISPGKHVIDVSAPGYTTKTIEINILPYEEKFIDISLKKTTTLRIESDKKIENAFFDNLPISLPLTLEVIPGIHKLILPNNFVRNNVEIEIPSQDEYTIKIDTHEKFLLSVSGKPNDAYVQIKDQVYKAPFNISFPEGVYNIKIFSQGYEEYKTTIDLDRNKTLYFALKPLEEVTVKFRKKGYTVEFDGFARESVPKSPIFTTIKDEKGNIVWLGFSDGTFEDIPKTIPILIGRNHSIFVANTIYNGPAIVHVQSGQRVLSFFNNEKIGEYEIKNFTIFDNKTNCLVNIYSKERIDVYWDGKYIGKTPIYLFNAEEGIHNVVFKNGGITLSEVNYEVRSSRLNEIKFGE